MTAGKIHHWKHGWIPLTPEAKAFVEGRGPNPTGGHSGRKPVLPKNRVPVGATKRQREVTGVGLVASGEADSMLDHIQRNGGFTYNPRTGGLLEVGKDKGFAIAIPGTETVVGVEKVNADDIKRDDFARGVAKVIRDNKEKIAAGAVLGGWYSPERNTYMVELSEIFPPGDREAAIRVGKERNQEAIFDLATGETIVTGGTGDAHPKGDAISSFTAPPTPEAKAAAKFYTGPGFRPLNGALRSGQAPPPPPGSVGQYMSHLDSLLATSQTTKPVMAYRGIQSYPGFPDTMAPGTVYSEKGYMSTAVADEPPKNYQGDVIMSISIPPKANALDFNSYDLSHHPEERELLLPHGSQFRVVSDVRRPDGKRMISMELIPPGMSDPS